MRERQDLGALLHQLLGVVVEAEAPLLAAHGLDMWDYVVLTGLERSASPTQNQLAGAVGRDKTRLIPVLDRLQGRGLVQRQPDPLDRRNRIVSLTAAGRDLLVACRGDVRAMESRLLGVLEPGVAATFVGALERLARDG